MDTSKVSFVSDSDLPALKLEMCGTGRKQVTTKVNNKGINQRHRVYNEQPLMLQT